MSFLHKKHTVLSRNKNEFGPWKKAFNLYTE